MSCNVYGMWDNSAVNERVGLEFAWCHLGIPSKQLAFQADILHTVRQVTGNAEHTTNESTYPSPCSELTTSHDLYRISISQTQNSCSMEQVRSFRTNYFLRTCQHSRTTEYSKPTITSTNCSSVSLFQIVF